MKIVVDISENEWIKIASGFSHPSNVAKELAKLSNVYPKSNKPNGEGILSKIMNI